MTWGKADRACLTIYRSKPRTISTDRLATLTCHSEHVSRSPERSEGEESHIAQGDKINNLISTEIWAN